MAYNANSNYSYADATESDANVNFTAGNTYVTADISDISGV